MPGFGLRVLGLVLGMCCRDVLGFRVVGIVRFGWTGSGFKNLRSLVCGAGSRWRGWVGDVVCDGLCVRGLRKSETATGFP